MTVIHCDYCRRPAQLVTGTAIYPKRLDLAGTKFWFCAMCEAWVPCHKPGTHWLERGKAVTSDGTRPLGRLANAKLRAAQLHARDAFDPLWRSGYMGRRQANAWLAEQLGVSDCRIELLDLPTCRRVPGIVQAHRVEMAQPRKEPVL